MLEKVTATTGNATTFIVRPGNSFGNGIIIGIVIGSVVAVIGVIGLKCCGIIAWKRRNMYRQGNPSNVGSVLLTKKNYNGDRKQGNICYQQKINSFETDFDSNLELKIYLVICHEFF